MAVEIRDIGWTWAYISMGCGGKSGVIGDEEEDRSGMEMDLVEEVWMVCEVREWRS